MSYSIKPLSPALATTFTDYLSNLDFGHEPHWATCFCRYYHSNCSADQWQIRTGEHNRLEAVDQIQAGKMKGYLAFDGDKCIGWCNANDASQYIRLEQDIKHIMDGKKVGCVICFVIHPDYRKQGVARLLLKKAVEDFRQGGFDAVLALPVGRMDNPEKHYRGTLNMYKELGFVEIEKHDPVSVMLLEF